jgi:hypothetical protein
MYLTPDEVSARFGGRITVRTLANWRWAGSGPKFTRAGGRILYPVKELEDWEERRTVAHTSQYRK